MRKEPRPEIKTRDINEVCPNIEKIGFNYYTLADIIRAGWCVEVKAVDEVPDKAHWVILYLDSTTTHDCYADDGRGDSLNFWRMYVFDEKPLWEQVVQAYFEDAADMESPTNKGQFSSRGPMKLAFFEASGKVLPHVTVALAMDPRK